jgi:uncharacterized protein
VTSIVLIIAVVASVVLTLWLVQRTTRSGVEVRGSPGGQMRIGGYALKFGVSSNPLAGGFTEVVQPAFVNRSKGDGWPGVIARFEHRSDMLLGATHSGTLRRFSAS